jgi:hypothetical protein
VTGTESWFYHFDPETKWQSLEWNHMTSPKKEARTISLAIKLMGTVFWNAEGCILVDFLLEGEPSMWFAKFRC